MGVLFALLVYGTVVVAALHTPQPHYLEDLQRLVYSDSSDLKAALRVELTLVEERKHHTYEYCLGQPHVLPRPKCVAGYLSAVRIDEQEDVAPTLPTHRRKVRTKASLGLSGYALNFTLVWPLLRPHSLMAAARCLLLEQILHLAGAFFVSWVLWYPVLLSSTAPARESLYSLGSGVPHKPAVGRPQGGELLT